MAKGRKSIYRPKLLALLSDNRAWTIQELNAACDTRRNSSLSTTLYALEKEGLVERAGIVAKQSARIPLFRLASQPSCPAEAQTDNPFLWRTYRQYRPEASSHQRG